MDIGMVGLGRMGGNMAGDRGPGLAMMRKGFGAHAVTTSGTKT
ncbi:MAG: hypothetical protein ABI812_01420 [Betaproteobacteria bacterium]